MTKKSTKKHGIFLALLAASLWGLSGNSAQFLFEFRELTPEWLVMIRLLGASILLLTASVFQHPREIKKILTTPKDLFDLGVFSLLGMLLVQYSFFKTIRYSNAAAATLLQYIGPVFIASFYIYKEKRLPKVPELVALVSALIGTFFLATHGDWQTLQISLQALVWGLISAISLATYSILPLRLLSKYSSPSVIGLALLGAGLSLTLFVPFTPVPGIWDIWTVAQTVFVIVFGTCLAFVAYLLAAKFLGATHASLLACAEPLTAAVVSVIWLSTPFGFMDALGGFFIILTVVLLTLFSSEKNTHSTSKASTSVAE
jgi:drug/metabolite transporter (DMT)-like permease